MFLLVAAAMAASTPPATPPVSAQATATIRVVAGVRLKLDAQFNLGAPPRRDATVRLPDGTLKPAKLIEFQ